MTTGAPRTTTGEHRDDAGELALEAHLAFLGHRRFSGETSAAGRSRSRGLAGSAGADETHELDALMAIFVGC
jgi:hypothetical protein